MSSTSFGIALEKKSSAIVPVKIVFQYQVRKRVSTPASIKQMQPFQGSDDLVVTT